MGTRPMSKNLGASLDVVTSAMWSRNEELLHQIYLLFKTEPNEKMKSIVRLYKGVIQYNPLAFKFINDYMLYDELTCLLIRIICHHTDQRRPDGVCPGVLTKASDMTLNGLYDFKYKKLTDLGHFPQGKDLEFYAYRLQAEINMRRKENEGCQNQNQDSGEDDPLYSNARTAKPSRGQGCSRGPQQDPQEKTPLSGKQGGGEKKEEETHPSESTLQGEMDEETMAEYAEGWEDDPFNGERVRQKVQETILSGKGWGSIPGNAQEAIKASQEPKLDYREMLRGFQASILASPRCLTRMKPNRRTGFIQMGSKRSMQSKLLVAIDTSGSVATKSLEGFFSVINHMFRFGIDEIDVVQFDCEVTTPIQNIKKAVPEVQIMGRGGTDFGVVLKKVMEEKKSYDGILFFTDGYAPCPEIPLGLRAKLFWLMDSEEAWKNNKSNLESTGRTAWMSLEKEVSRLSV